MISVEGTAESTQSLMPIVGALTGGTIVFTASTNFTIVPSGSETISVPEAGNVSAIQMTRGDTVTLTRDVTRWWVSSYYKAAAGPLIGSAVNAKMSVMAPSATATFSADEVCPWAVLVRRLGRFQPPSTLEPWVLAAWILGLYRHLGSLGCMRSTTQ